jgi:protease-4
VILYSYNYRGLLNKVGIRPEVFKSGKFKDMLSGDKEPSEILPEERQMVQGLIDETFARFKDVVAEGRAWANAENDGHGRVLSSDWRDYADGRVLSGKQAAELGFVDELGNFDTAEKRARELAGVATADLISYQQPVTFSKLFRLLSKSDDTTLKVDLGMDLPRLEAGRLYFLSSTFLH